MDKFSEVPEFLNKYRKDLHDNPFHNDGIHNQAICYMFLHIHS